MDMLAAFELLTTTLRKHVAAALLKFPWSKSYTEPSCPAEKTSKYSDRSSMVKRNIPSSETGMLKV